MKGDQTIMRFPNVVDTTQSLAVTHSPNASLTTKRYATCFPQQYHHRSFEGVHLVAVPDCPLIVNSVRRVAMTF